MLMSLCVFVKQIAGVRYTVRCFQLVLLQIKLSINADSMMIFQQQLVAPYLQMYFGEMTFVNVKASEKLN